MYEKDLICDSVALYRSDLGASTVRHRSDLASALQYRSASHSEYGGKGSSSSGRLLGDLL